MEHKKYLLVLLSLSLMATNNRPQKIYHHLNPPSDIKDPYQFPNNAIHSPDAVCGILFENEKRSYRTLTFASANDATLVHAHVTHLGPCGTCSSLQDLEIYQNIPDLTKPAQKCAFLSWLPSASILCFKKIGLSDACAQSWYFNAKNTRKKCLWTCLGSAFKSEPSNKINGSLNDCLACDEKESGPGFLQSAGRTRRNSGLPSSIKRPRQEIAPLIHDYF